MRFKQLLLTELLCGASLLMGAGTHLNARERGFTPAATPAINTALSFVENIGQVHNQHQQPRPDIDFRLSAGKGLSVFIGSGQIHYQWAKAMDKEQLKMNNDEMALSGKEDHSPKTYQMYRMDVTLLGANPDAVMEKEGQQAFYERYYLPGMPQGAKANSFGKVTYKDVYPDIDWVFYFNTAGQLEYDFLVRPGGNPADIKIKYAGAEQLALNSDGSLSAATPLGKISEQAPYSYDGQGRAVASRFRLEGNVVSFAVGHYSGTLTIDPTVEWATYFGDLGNDQPSGIVADENGDVYMVGGTTSLNNIATTGSFQTTYGGPTGGILVGDAFLAKFNPSGECLWATYYGGTGEDIGLDAAWDGSSQHVYLAGTTKSTAGIATAGAQQQTEGGNYDAFLVQFDTTGQRVWGTYYGGSGAEGSNYAIGTCCDKNGNVFLTGESNSNNDIATPGAYQTTPGGSGDAFVVKFDSTGTREWATYLGGNGNDQGFKITSDSSGNVFIVGHTTSTSGFSTAGSQQSANGGGTDGFVIKLDSAGMMQWATYCGGSGFDYINSVQTDLGGNCYVAGTTTSLSGISTTGSFQSTYGGGPTDGFLAKYDASGQLSWSTYYGGSDIDETQSILINDGGAIFVAGYSISATGIATPGSYMDTLYNATSESFISKFDNTGQQLWGSYFGGSGYETSGYITIANGYELYLAGLTNSAVGIGTAGSYQPDFGGGDGDAFLTKLNVCETPEQPGAIMGDTVLCSGQAYIFSVDSVAGALSYTWTLPNGWTGSSDSTSISIIPAAGFGSIAVSANNSCAASDSSTLDISVNASPEPVIVNTNGTLSTTLPYSSYQWNQDGQAINGATAATYVVTTNGDYSVTVTNESGCRASSDTLSLQHVGIEELQDLAKSISVYPNPTSAMVHIQSPVKVAVKLFSLEGRLLRRVENAESFSLKDLAPGMYLMKIYDKAGQLIKVTKIVRQ